MSAIQMAVLLMVSGGTTPFSFTPTISADTSNYNLRSAALAAGWDGVAPLNATVTINSGIVVSANATSQYAFDTGASFPAGSTLAVVNNGFIIGMGGAGAPTYPRQAGAAGGPAFRAQAAVTVTNNGTIGGGGGGGGSGSIYDSEQDGELYGGGAGGGGRTGRTNSSGGAGANLDGMGSSPSGNGGAGTFTSAGAGGGGGVTSDYYGPGSSGGAGGTWGAAGSAGQNSTAGGSGYEVLYAAQTAGGAAGAAVVGNSNITWAATGTRLGALT